MGGQLARGQRGSVPQSVPGVDLPIVQVVLLPGVEHKLPFMGAIFLWREKDEEELKSAAANSVTQRLLKHVRCGPDSIPPGLLNDHRPTTKPTTCRLNMKRHICLLQDLGISDCGEFAYCLEPLKEEDS